MGAIPLSRLQAGAGLARPRAGGKLPRPAGEMPLLRGEDLPAVRGGGAPDGCGFRRAFLAFRLDGGALEIPSFELHPDNGVVHRPRTLRYPGPVGGGGIYRGRAV